MATNPEDDITREADKNIKMALSEEWRKYAGTSAGTEAEVQSVVDFTSALINAAVDYLGGAEIVRLRTSYLCVQEGNSKPPGGSLWTLPKERAALRPLVARKCNPSTQGSSKAKAAPQKLPKPANGIPVPSSAVIDVQKPSKSETIRNEPPKVKEAVKESPKIIDNTLNTNTSQTGTKQAAVAPRSASLSAIRPGKSYRNPISRTYRSPTYLTNVNKPVPTPVPRRKNRFAPVAERPCSPEFPEVNMNMTFPEGVFSAYQSPGNHTLRRSRLKPKVDFPNPTFWQQIPNPGLSIGGGLPSPPRSQSRPSRIERY